MIPSQWFKFKGSTIIRFVLNDTSKISASSQCSQLWHKSLSVLVAEWQDRRHHHRVLRLRGRVFAERIHSALAGKPRSGGQLSGVGRRTKDGGNGILCYLGYFSKHVYYTSMLWSN